MQFQVPQFIDVEDKIFGPFSFKQFAYLAGGAGGCFVFYQLLPLFLAIPLILVFGGLALALVFYKVNGRPFINVLESGFNYYISGRLYIWRKDRNKKREAEKKVKELQDKEDDLSNFNYVPRLSNSKLKDLSWSLDVLDMEKKQK
jgi:hypothetical protein